jgi:hypothetical protein
VFLTLLVITFLVAAGVSWLVARAFEQPIDGILRRIIDSAISGAWAMYMRFALLVVGISSGVRIFELEKYITPPRSVPGQPGHVVQLTSERWVLEIYRTVIDTLQGTAWIMLVFFVATLVAYVVIRLGELRRSAPKPPETHIP